MIRIIHGLVMVFVLLSAYVFLERSVNAASENTAILTVKVSPDANKQTQLQLRNKKIFRHIAQSKARQFVNSIPVSDTYLTVRGKGIDVTYVVDRNGQLFNEQNKEMIKLEVKMRMELLKDIEKLRTAHYGKMLQWDQVKDMIPLQSKFKVIDMETGLTFNVQRRAGKRHADVQPLTPKDTSSMKQIYNGTWSWKRKAILVQTADQLIAASMHGMPHGGDGIPDNDFPGHFCIHFLGSSTHRSRNVDPEHQLMIRKAAGNVPLYVDHASPYGLVDTFFDAFNLKESQILKMIVTHPTDNQLLEFLSVKPHVRIRKSPAYVEKDTSRLLALEIPIQVSVYENGPRGKRTAYTFGLQRMSLMDPWKINFIQQEKDLRSQKPKVQLSYLST
jgi:hypothetical protein